MIFLFGPLPIILPILFVLWLVVDKDKDKTARNLLIVLLSMCVSWVVLLVLLFVGAWLLRPIYG